MFVGKFEEDPTNNLVGKKLEKNLGFFHELGRKDNRRLRELIKKIKV